VVQNAADAAWARTAAPSASAVVAPAAHYSPREMLRTPPVGVDLWHSPHPYQWAIGARHRTVLTLLDLIQITHAMGLKNVVAREPLRAIIWGACRRADRFVAISATTREAFCELLGVPRERICVTPLAPDPRFGAPAEPSAVAAARARWDLPERVVLYVGMTQPHKNLDRLLQAIALLVRERPRDPLALAVVGPVVPAERGPLLARMHALGIADRVRLLDWLSDDDVRLAYHAAGALALPSLEEGFGLTALEAMQCGTPCVVSDIPVLREVTGGAAELVDPRDPTAIAGGLRAVLDDPVRSAALRALGRANVARFSWRASARETLAAYEAALADAPRGVRWGVRRGAPKGAVSVAGES
jgi:glycosyltransferase involved in cell wall biosynthesis